MRIFYTTQKPKTYSKCTTTYKDVKKVKCDKNRKLHLNYHGKIFRLISGRSNWSSKKEKDFYVRSIAEVPIAHHACVNYQPQLPLLIICSFFGGGVSLVHKNQCPVFFCYLFCHEEAATCMW